MTYATIDIETTGLNRFKDKVTWIGIGISKGDDFVKEYYLDMREGKDLDKFKSICSRLKERKVKTVFQNGKFDTLFIAEQYGITLPIHEDVMLMGTAYDLAAEHGLKDMAQRYLGVPDWDISKKEKLSGNDSIIPYLKCDVRYTWELFRYFQAEMTPQQVKIYKKILKPAYLMYRDTEKNGIYLSVDNLRQVREDYKQREKEKLDWLNSKYKINWNSSAQIADVLFSEDKENCPVLKKSAKTNKPSANAEVLNRLAAKGYEIPKVLLEYKAVNTLNKMFLNRWENDLGSDKRLHPSFNLTNVVTGRTSCLIAGTQVLVPNGSKNIEDIVPGDLVFSKTDDGTVTVSKVTWSGCTGVRSDLYKITYKTQGKHNLMCLIATSDHLIYTVESGYVRVDSLKVGDRLTALHKGIKCGRPYLYATGQDEIAEHVVIYKGIHGYLPEHIHHVDFDKLNNDPDNLIGMTGKEHTSLHAKLTATPEKMRKASSFSHNEKWRQSQQKMQRAKMLDVPKEKLIGALIKGNGIVGATKILHRDYTYVLNRMKYWGIKYDGRRSVNQRLILNDNHYIISIEKVNAPTKVYDITVEKTHNFYANEICVHNCANPNLQQVPRDKTVRGLFDAPEGRLFFEADYSQLELRIAAEYSHDPVMLDIYKNGGDIHTTTAKLMTGGREPTKQERSRAKAVNFGFLYGMLAKKFVDYAYNSYGVVFSQREAELFREAFFTKYARLLPWHKEMEYECELMGGVANKFGRFRKLPNIYSQDKFERLSAVRRAINTPVQGTGSDLLISAATKINHDLKKEGVKIVGTVHDSILGEFRAEDKDWVCEYIRKVMLHPPILDDFGVELEVPLDIDIGIGAWGAHG